MKTIISQFDTNRTLVDDLMTFDRFVMEYSVNALKHVQESLLRGRLDGPARKLDPHIQALSKVREHDSLRPKYNAMVNQCVVLLVSYFSTAIEDVFRFHLARRIKAGNIDRFAKESVHVSFSELHDCGFDLSEKIGNIVTAMDDVSFQDMKSVNRLFSKYFDYNHQRNSDLSNIIFGQAVRNIIVHDSGRMNERFIRQIKSCSDRTIQTHLPSDGVIQLSPNDISDLGQSMWTYLTDIEQNII